MENSDESLSTPPKGAKDLALMTRRRRGKAPWGDREENRKNIPLESNELPDVSHLEELPMSHPEFERLREWWKEKYDNIMAPVPLEMPPLREVNHQILLKDPEKKFRENTPRCPAAMQEALAIKIDRYMKAGWWFPATSE